MEMTPQERHMFVQYERMSDAEIFDMVRDLTNELGHPPRKQDMVCSTYLKSRFGPWHRFLEAAGVKPISQKQKQKNERKAKQAKKQQKHQERLEQKRKTKTQINPSGRRESQAS